MKSKVVIIAMVSILIMLSPTMVVGEEEGNAVDEKSVVYIKGESHQYKFGSFVHIGRIWWCPNFDVRLIFDVNDKFIFSINGEEQTVTSDRVSISMDSFFGIAPTLYSFLNNDIVRIYGVCDEVIFEEA